METTIAAISTAMSASGIGIIRISGENAMDVISRIYRSKGGKKKIKEVPTHTIHYGYIYDGEELIDEPAVPGVDHDHFKAGALGEGGFFSVGGHDVGNLFFGEGLDRATVGAHAVAGTVLGERRLFFLVHEIGARVLAGMGELHAGNRAVTAYGVGHHGEARQGARRLQFKMQHVGGVRGRMYDKLTHGDVGAAALRPVFVEGAAPRSGAAVPGDVGGAGGRGEHAVAEGDSAEGDGGTQMRIFSRHTFSRKKFFYYPSHEKAVL